MSNIIVWVAIIIIGMFASYHHVSKQNTKRHLRPVNQAVKTPSSKSVYYIEDGTLHHIPDWNTFVSLGYDVDDIKVISDEELAKIPMGEAAGQIWEDKVPDSPLKDCPCISNSGIAAAESVNATHGKLHKICFINSTETEAVLKTFDPNHLQIHYSVIPESLYHMNYGGNDTKARGNITQLCDVVMKIVNASSLIKYVCPETCVPVPYTEVPIDLLLPGSQQLAMMNGSSTVTCSMTIDNLFAEGTELHHHHTHGRENHSVPVSADQAHLANRHAHMSTGHILRAIARRRIEECLERYYWTTGSSSVETHFIAPTRRKVHGLVIWTGTRTRYYLVEAQIGVLRNQTLRDMSPENIIVGWMSSEDQYPCRVGTSLCETATSSNAYYHYMPTTRLNFASAGWGCAQRRPLRSVAHTLLLYDPDFLLILDDDTYLSMPVLEKMDPFIRSNVMKDNNVYGQLTKGKKVTKQGFYYGGSGYLIGKKVIDKLNAFQVEGPKEESNWMIDSVMMKELSVFNQAVQLSEAVCPDCLKLRPGSGQYVLNSTADSSVRLIEMCVNMMAQEHTCYHSDHSISRCFIHGANAYPMHVECGGSRMEGGLTVGMCMGTGWCDTNVQLTCHRWKPTAKNSGIPRDIYSSAPDPE